MPDTIEGGCRCGHIRYRLALDRLPNVYACHCLDCQTWSGSAFSVNFFMPESQIALTGEPVLYERTNPGSGRTSRQFFCPVCHTRVYNTNSARPGSVTMRGGTLDRSDELSIIAHIWTKRKMKGVEIPDDIPSWPEHAPPSEFVAALMKV
ncbi:MAG: GFA family protein [Rhizomicrobium sp.]|jgi:hypothetical protein